MYLAVSNDAAVHLPPTRQLPPVGTDGQFWISSSVVVEHAVALVADVVAPPAALHKSAHSKKAILCLRSAHQMHAACRFGIEM